MDHDHTRPSTASPFTPHRAPWIYWLLAAALTAYVALATPNRSEHRLADAWEHHRAVRHLALVDLAHTPLSQVGNPTYANDDPSIRYSPYTVALASLCRATGIDPFDALSLAATFNTAMLAIALWLLLRSFNRAAVALPALLVALTLYAQPPNYANSLALEDLPWHQVNPSAFSLWLCILGWVAWKWGMHAGGRAAIAAVVVNALFLALALLSHAMTGLIGLVGLAAHVLAHSGRPRASGILSLAVTTLVAIALCAAWPLYPFLRALRGSGDTWFWYNPAIVQLMLSTWCLPALLAALLAWPRRDDPLVAWCLRSLAIIALLTILAVVTRSATLARLPLAGLLFAQVLVGVTLWHSGVLNPSRWGGLLRDLMSPDRARFAHSFAPIVVVALMALFALGQASHILRKPHLLRPVIARWTNHPDKQPRLREHYAEVLAPVGARDVVFGARETTWPVPSFNGRVFAAEHLEYFTPSQKQSWDDVDEFFSPATTDTRRADLLDRSAASWLLLDVPRDSANIPSLTGGPAADCRVGASGSLVLIDARCWADAMRETPR